MDQLIYKELKKFGKTRVNIGLAKFTTFKIGGPAEIFIEVTEPRDFVKLLNFLSGEGVPYFVLGGGSNLLISDAVYEGVVIKNSLSRLERSATGISAESGVIFGAMTALSLKSGLTGLEWSAGLPGTVGGAVRGNAGAAGGDTAGSLENILAWIDGEEAVLKPEECRFGYRDSIFKHNGGIILSANFKLIPGDSKKSQLIIQEILGRRSDYYPPYPSAGSFFKNVRVADWPAKAGDLPVEFLKTGKVPAGWINEKAGLKGYRVGGAMVSEQHGNFLVNYENATFGDLVKLVEEVKARVYNKFGVNLEEEVQIIS